jgi:uncharacterized protein YkwD
MTNVLRGTRAVGAAIVTIVVIGTASVTSAALSSLDRPAIARVGAARLQTTPVASPEVRDLQGVLQLINGHRAAAGQPPVTGNAKVAAAAQAHSNDQAANNTMSHTGSDGANTGTRLRRAGFTWMAWGENVAAGQPDVPTVIDAWMNSPGHRAIILGDFQYMNVAVARAADGTPYWTLVAASGS